MSEELCPRSVKKTLLLKSKNRLQSSQALPCAWEYSLRHLPRALPTWLGPRRQYRNLHCVVREPTNAPRPIQKEAQRAPEGAGLSRNESAGRPRGSALKTHPKRAQIPTQYRRQGRQRVRMKNLSVRRPDRGRCELKFRKDRREWGRGGNATETNSPATLPSDPTNSRG